MNIIFFKNKVIQYFLLNAPYVIALHYIHENFPKLVSPSLIFFIMSLIILQTALIFHTETIFMKSILIYIYLICFVFLLISIASQFITGNDLSTYFHILLKKLK